MSDLRTAALRALEYLDAPSSKLWPAGTHYQIITALRAALADQNRGWYTVDEINAKFAPDPVLKPEPPPEAQTEAEKIAYCAGWWAALEKARTAEPVQEPASKMTAGRAAYFMARFKREEKMLGPNEQAALDFVISMLEAALAEPVQEPGFWGRVAARQASRIAQLETTCQQALDILDSEFTTVDGEFCRWCDGRLNAKHNCKLEQSIVALKTALSTTREHITDGSPCWCSPELNYVDPDTGVKVWVHKEPQ